MTVTVGENAVPAAYKKEPFNPAETGETIKVPFKPEFIVISTVAPAIYGSLKMNPPRPPHEPLIVVLYSFMETV